MDYCEQLQKERFVAKLRSDVGLKVMGGGDVAEDGADAACKSGSVGEVSAHATAEPQEDILDPVSTSGAGLRAM